MLDFLDKSIVFVLDIWLARGINAAAYFVTILISKLCMVFPTESGWE